MCDGIGQVLLRRRHMHLSFVCLLILDPCNHSEIRAEALCPHLGASGSLELHALLYAPPEPLPVAVRMRKLP